MTSALSSKLKSLGVKVGARDVAPQPAEKEKRLNRYAIENVLNGRVFGTDDGECFVVEHQYSTAYRHGHTPLHKPLELNAIARWARDERIANCARECLVF
ncbi:MAG: hypothetical protein LC737_09720, partial [Chloroflexi bacterium]|nr:hypothetical protein [Chloroflexota bacterium]